MCVEVENKNSKNIALNLVYRPPNGDHKERGNYLESSLSKREISHKEIILAGDFNINLLDFDANKKVQNFVNLMFCFGIIPTINKPTRVTRQAARAIDYIIANSIIDTGFKSGIIKTDISDHFPIFFCYKYIAEKEVAEKKFIYKRRFSDQSIGTLKIRLRDINWSKAGIGIGIGMLYFMLTKIIEKKSICINCIIQVLAHTNRYV